MFGTENQLKEGKEKCEVIFGTDETAIANMAKENEILSFRQILSFSDCQNKAESDALKRCLGLPITKQLRHMTRISDGWAEESVSQIDITEEYPGWCTLKVELDNSKVIMIHHAFFSHMQKPSFVEDMKKEDVGE